METLLYLKLLAAISFIILRRSVLGSEDPLPECTNVLYKYNGYTYSYQPGYRVWSHCNFVSPVNPESGLCGVTKTWQDVYICDPDSLLVPQRNNNSLAEEIGDSLQDFVSTLTKDCPKPKRGAVAIESIVIALIAVDAIQVPEANAEDLCQNTCGEIHPFYDDVELSTNSERKMAAENFAVQLLAREWLIGRCNNQLLTLYVAQHNKLWFHFGEQTIDRFGEELLDHMVIRMQTAVEQRTNNTDLADALSQSMDILTTLLQKEMKSLASPAMILLYAFLALLLLLGLALSALFLVLTKQNVDSE